MHDQEFQEERLRSRRSVQIVFATISAGSVGLALFTNSLASSFHLPPESATGIAGCFLIMGSVSATLMFTFDRAFKTK